MEKENKRHALVITSVLVLTLIIVVRVSFAFFSASINGNSQDISVQAARLGSLEYTPIDNLNLGNAAMPGASSEADFTVTYVGSGVDLTYDLELTVTADTFNNIDTSKQLLLTIKGNTNKENIPIKKFSNTKEIKDILNYEKISEHVSPDIEITDDNTIVIDLTDGSVIKPGEDNSTYKIIKNVKISEHETHTYKLNLSFINYDNVAQDKNQGAEFQAKIKVSNPTLYEFSQEYLGANCSTPEIGCEVSLAGEMFNIINIGDDEREGQVSLLAKYNLNVGNYKDEGTEGIQNKNTIGYKVREAKFMDAIRGRYSSYTDILELDSLYDSYTLKGAIPYDNKSECSHSIDDNHTSYEGSTIKKYADTYENYIKSALTPAGEDEIIVRIPEKEELINEDTMKFYDAGGVEAKTGYEFIFNTSFWTRTPSDSSYVYVIMGGEVQEKSPTDPAWGIGIRPIVLINKSLLWNENK